MLLKSTTNCNCIIHIGLPVFTPLVYITSIIRFIQLFGGHLMQHHFTFFDRLHKGVIMLFEINAASIIELILFIKQYL